MVNTFFNLVKAKLVSEIRKPAPKLILFMLLDKFAILSLILPPLIPSLQSISSLLLLDEIDLDDLRLIKLLFSILK